MRPRKTLLLLIFLFTVGCKQSTIPQPADMVLVNGGIYTIDSERRWAEAAAIRDGEIIAVGANAAIQPYIGADTRVIDLHGRMAMPGIHDSHLHPLEGGYDQIGCSLWDYHESVEQVLTVLRECAARSDGKWFTATGLDLGLFGLHGPDNVLLEGIAPGRFIFVDGADGHAALVNDKVLALAAIDQSTADPKGGVIERRDDGAVPNGTLRETARDIVVALQPPRELEKSTEAMRHAVHLMHSYGITSVIDAWIGEHEMAVYQSLDRSGELNLRVFGAITDEGVFEKQAGNELQRIISERHKYESDLVSYNSIKFYVDGVFEGETAYLLSPYNSEPHRGAPNLTAEKLRDRVQRYYNMGLQLHFHTMGDGAVRITLDALEFARKQGDPVLLKNHHTLAHLGLIDPADMPRFAELNAAPNFTPVWAGPDEWMMALEIPALGPERVNHMYPIRSVHQAGARVVAGSDWNYGDLDPLLSIETAVTRQDPRGPSEFTGDTSEAVDLATIIDAYTINGAWLAGNDDRVGSIEVGKRADIVVYDQNLFAIEPELISDVRVDVTMFDGRIVYERSEQVSGQDIDAQSRRSDGKVLKIVALGDSTTEADWEGNAKEVYASRLVGELARHGVLATVVNAGISNTTGRQAVARLDADVRQYHPDIVIVQFGINDSWIDASLGRSEPRLTLDEFAECLTTIIKTLRGDGARVILMTPNPMRWSQMYGEELRDPALGFDFADPRGINRLLDIYVHRVREVAAKNNVELIDVFANFEAYGQVEGHSIHELLIPGDEMHPNDTGHALIAGWLAEQILSAADQ